MAKFLSAAQIAQFIENGYLVLKEAVPKSVALQWTEDAFGRLDYDIADPNTWAVSRHHLGGTKSVDVAEFAPAAYQAMCDLVGGEDRIRAPWRWSDSFILNLGKPGVPWAPPSPASGGWHKDGDFFRHFLDSPEQGILCIVCWSGMQHKSGATFIAPDSVGRIARYLAEHPEGLKPEDAAFGTLIEKCSEFVELVAEPGDVVLHHPYMLHTQSVNERRDPRVITNPPVALREPMRFDRPDNDHSPVERAVLRGLGVERFSFQATGPRERFEPAWRKAFEERQREEAAEFARRRQAEQKAEVAA